MLAQASLHPGGLALERIALKEMKYGTNHSEWLFTLFEVKLYSPCSGFEGTKN